MKKIFFILLLAITVLAACEKDNYDPPKSALTGRLIYEGTPIGVRQGIGVLQLYQPGWQDVVPIGVQMKQDGTFSSLLFDGAYKLVPIEGNGPFVASNTDTINLEVKGNETTVDVPVTPYFIINNETFQKNGPSSITATFKISQVVASASLDKVGLFVGETMLVDNLFNSEKSEINGTAISDLNQSLTLNVNVTDAKSKYVFVRVGVKAKESAEYLFTQVQKIQIQ